MKALSPTEIVAVLDQARIAHVGVLADGEPYVTPLSFVPTGDGIAFRSVIGKRLDAIAAHPNVSVEITLHDEATGSWRSIVASGHATLVEDHTEETAIVQAILSKYPESFKNLLGDTAPGRGYIVRVSFDQVTGRGSGGAFEPRSRPGRL